MPSTATPSPTASITGRCSRCIAGIPVASWATIRLQEQVPPLRSDHGQAGAGPGPQGHEVSVPSHRSWSIASENPDRAREAAQVQADLKAVGITMGLHPVPRATWIKDGNSGKTPFMLSDWYRRLSRSAGLLGLPHPHRRRRELGPLQQPQGGCPVRQGQRGAGRGDAREASTSRRRRSS